MSCEGPRPRCCHCQHGCSFCYTLLSSAGRQSTTLSRRHNSLYFETVWLWEILKPQDFNKINVSDSLYSTHNLVFGFFELYLCLTFKTWMSCISALTCNLSLYASVFKLWLQALGCMTWIRNYAFLKTFIWAMGHDPKWILALLLLGFHMTRGVIINFFPPQE